MRLEEAQLMTWQGSASFPYHHATEECKYHTSRSQLPKAEVILCCSRSKHAFTLQTNNVKYCQLA